MTRSIVFPSVKIRDVEKKNLQIQTYGHRLYRDQTFYEYLLEFLLIFVSQKSTGKTEERDQGFSFPKQFNEKQLFYHPFPRMGLKRFIFLSRSEPEKRFQVDIDAFEHHRDFLKRRINISDSSLDEEFILDILQDLLYGFNAIIGKRSWFAQSLLPVAPELIFCEAIGSKNKRESLNYERNINVVDSGFEFHRRNFMARGGEVYYLHVLQGLEKREEIRRSLEIQLKGLITSIPQLSSIANFIQDTWEEYHYQNNNKEGLQIITTAEWIPANYEERAEFSVLELMNLLNSLINPLEKITLLGLLILLQLMRLMCLQASKKLENSDSIEWVIDLTNDPNGQIRKIATTSYIKVEEKVYSAIHTANIESYRRNDEKARLKKDEEIFEDASKDTNRLFRKLGKDINFIIPPKGSQMRFSLSEQLLKLLVIILIEPGERMLLDSFLNKCYERYKIIIGPVEAKLHWNEKSDIDWSSFNDNLEIFQQMLKDSGFLRDLSDATSIVENPFKG